MLWTLFVALTDRRKSHLQCSKLRSCGSIAQQSPAAFSNLTSQPLTRSPRHRSHDLPSRPQVPASLKMRSKVSFLQTAGGCAAAVAVKHKCQDVQVIMQMPKTRSQNGGGSPHPCKAG